MSNATSAALSEPVVKRRGADNIYVRGFKRAFRKPLGLLAISVLGILVIAALGAPLFAPYDPLIQHRGDELMSPSATYFFGTDERGRDIFSRVLFGLRVSITAGVLATLMGGVVGSLLGLFAGVRKGVVGAVIMRFMDGMIAFPAILLGILVVVALGPGLLNLAVTIAVINVPVFARLAYAGALAESVRDYVTAAESLGATTRRIVLGHILLNAMSPLLVQMAMAMGFAVLVEASLGFLGLGLRPPSPSLGSIISTSRQFMNGHWYYPVLPGVVLGMLLLALNAVADTLNDALNPWAARR